LDWIAALAPRCPASSPPLEGSRPSGVWPRGPRSRGVFCRRRRSREIGNDTCSATPPMAWILRLAWVALAVALLFGPRSAGADEALRPPPPSFAAAVQIARPAVVTLRTVSDGDDESDDRADSEFILDAAATDPGLSGLAAQMLAAVRRR